MSTKQERIARERVIYYMWLAGQDQKNLLHLFQGEIPEAWHTIDVDHDVEEPKEKVTLYLDRSVARAFRAMGKGYQMRINRILQTWLQLKLGNVLNREARIKELYERISARNREELHDGRKG